MKPSLEQVVAARLQEFLQVWQSGVTEMTGKGRRDSGGAFVGRYGGLKPAYPELMHLKAGPKAIAAAIQRGRGKTYQDIVYVTSKAMEKLGYRPRRKYSRGALTIPPHAQVRASCKLCLREHSRREHRFHGPGSFDSTHLFAFGGGRNPVAVYSKITGKRIRKRKTSSIRKKRKQTKSFIRHFLGRAPAKPRRRGIWRRNAPIMSMREAKRRLLRYNEMLRRGLPLTNNDWKLLRQASQVIRYGARKQNPSHGDTKIYGKVLRIEAQKTGKHRCDAECRSANHRYFHVFRSAPALYGSADHKRLVIE